MATVTKDERRLARIMANDSGRIERAGVRAAVQIGNRARLAGIRAFRTEQDASIAIQRVLQAAISLLRDAMVVAHLMGVLRRTRELKPKLVISAAFSPEFGAAQEFLDARLSASKKEIKDLQEKYGPRAVAAVDKIGHTAQLAVQRTLKEAHLKGLTKRQAVPLLAESLNNIGMTALKSYQVEAIFRTQTQLAYSAGSWAATQGDPDIRDVLWGFKYVTVGDDRTRDEHFAIEGVTLPKDDGFWDINYPPNGWNCRCVAIPIFDERKHVKPPLASSLPEGVIPGADPGFRFNPGKVFGGGGPGTKPLVLKPKPKLPKPKVTKVPSPSSVTPLPFPKLKPKLKAPSLESLLTEDEVHAVFSYTQRSGSVVAQQRGLHAPTPNVQRWIKLLDSSMEKLPAFEGTTYRGMRMSAKEAAKFVSRDFIETEAFTSTSTRRSIAEVFGRDQRLNFDLTLPPKLAADAFQGKAAFVQLEIQVSKGAANINPLSAFKAQDEILLRKGLKFDIVSVAKEEGKDGLGYVVKLKQRTVGTSKPKVKAVNLKSKKPVEVKSKSVKKTLPSPTSAKSSVKPKPDRVPLRIAPYKPKRRILTQREKNLIRSYTDSGYYYVKMQRGLVPMSLEAKESLATLTRAFKAAPQRKGTFYRGMNLSRKQAKELSLKGTITTESFTSTSSVEVEARAFGREKIYVQDGIDTESWVEFRIKVKTSGADVKRYTTTKAFNEVVLRKNMNFDVVKSTKVVHEGRVGWVIDLEEIVE